MLAEAEAGTWLANQAFLSILLEHAAVVGATFVGICLKTSRMYVENEAQLRQLENLEP